MVTKYLQFTKRSQGMGSHHDHLSEKPFSLLQANEFFVHKILSRNSSFGRSARLSSCRLPGQIPFKWEAQPGKPKDQTLGKHVPSISLPPSAVSCEDLSKPYLVSKQQQPIRVRFWKKSKKKYRNAPKQNALFGSSRRHRDVDNIPMGIEADDYSRKSNDEYVLSSCISHSLSSSFSSSSSNSHGRRHSKFGSLAKGFIRWAF